MARVPFQFIPDDDNRRRKITNLLVCTKAYQAKDAILSVLPRLDTMAKNLKIIILSNGALDIRDQLVHDDTFSTFCAQVSSSHQRRPELVLCSTTHGVELDKSSHKSYNIDDDHDDDGGDDMFHILEVGEGGKTYIGGHPQIARLWDQSGLTTQSIPPEQMEALLWHKLCANCVCNPLTAIWNIANGQLAYVHPELFASIRKHVIEEVSNVGYASLEQQGFWDDFPNLYNQKSSLLSPLVLDDFISTVIEANLRNTSSMCRDVLRGQRTEVENLNGFVVRKGLEFGLPTPANAELVQKVQEMTNASAR
jgi:2-dehydropantoate 2-reductase